jgi:N-acetylglucosaminyldiphosphoundecaprenol N-acetyl-beta-D-mannosaminyltransferase
MTFNQNIGAKQGELMKLLGSVRDFENYPDLFKSLESDTQSLVPLISTINLQHLRLCSEMSDFYQVYKGSSVLVPDGVPIIKLINFYFHKKLRRIPGVEICDFILKSEKKIFVLGSKQETLRKIRELYKLDKSQLDGWCGIFDYPAPENLLNKIRAEIQSFRPNYIILALGSPKSELAFGQLCMPALKSKAICVGLGGSLDILSTQFTRAPILFQNLGLEWVWRLFQSPFRLFPRYFRDAKFLLKFCIESFNWDRNA